MMRGLMRKTDIGFYSLLGVTTAFFLYYLSFVFFQTPLAQEQAGGIAQKIFYFHVPSAYGMYLAGCVCLVSSAGYLVKPNDTWNGVAQAAAEAAALFGIVVLTSGPLWAKKAWGVYWTWEPRLTTSLLSVMLYVALVVLRTFFGEGHAERKFAAALGVLGTVNLPIVHYAVKKWGGTHPMIMNREGGLEPVMLQGLLMGFAAVTLLAALLLWLRSSVNVGRSRAERLEQFALERGLID